MLQCLNSNLRHWRGVGRWKKRARKKKIKQDNWGKKPKEQESGKIWQSSPFKKLALSFIISIVLVPKWAEAITLKIIKAQENPPSPECLAIKAKAKNKVKSRAQKIAQRNIFHTGIVEKDWIVAKKSIKEYQWD